MILKKRVLAGRSRKLHFLRYFGCKILPGRSYISSLIAIGLIIAVILFIFPLNANLFLIPENFKAIIAGRFFCLDYITLISHTLPGLLPREKAEEPAKETDIYPQSSLWQDYPHLLLSSELAGLQTLVASKTVFSSAVEMDANVPEWGAKESEENADFLAGENTMPAREKPFTFKDEKPLLLIYHTHTSESFLPVSGEIYATDPKQTIVFLGAALAQTLQEDYGIPVLHHREVFDQPRGKAYQKASPVIEKILQQNPQIEVVLDLHRDGVSRKITTANISGRDIARILFVIETHHQGWSSNLRFALFLEDILQRRCPDISRGILKNVFACYNQHLHPRSILIEIGGHENSKEELLGSIPYLAEVLGEAFR